jgi:hypothetical protein
MTMNRIGKTLVLINTAASFVALAWALGLYFQFTDWGWKEPRSEFGLRVPSEFDKRSAAFKEAVKARDLALPALATGWKGLREAQERFPQNHLYYKQELARLQSATEPIEIKTISRKDGTLVLDTGAKPIGKPALGDKLEGLTKSYDGYLTELKEINEKIDAEVKEVGKWVAKAQEITNALGGKTGIYDLLETEKKAQDQARFEKEYLQPIWASARNQAEVLSDRRDSLENALARLRGGKK